jgi:hypothetical protein
MIEEALDNGLTNLNDKLVTTLQSVDLSTIDVRDIIIHGISSFFWHQYVLLRQMEHWDRRMANVII